MIRWHILNAILSRQLREWMGEKHMRFFFIAGIILPMLVGVPMLKGFQSSATRAFPVVPLVMILGYGPLLASMLGMTLGLESFVGEKEKKTLELLLATPANDTELFCAKTFACVITSTMIGVLFLVVGLLEMSIFSSIYNLYANADVVLKIVAIVFVTQAGVGLIFTAMSIIISSRVATMKAGQQIMAVAIWVLVMGVMIISMTIGRVMSGRSSFLKILYSKISELPFWAIILGIIVILAIVNAIALAIAAKTFDREKMLTSM